MSIVLLPPEILTIVLLSDAIPPHERIRLRRVAKNWLDILEPALKKQKKLVIYGSCEYLPHAKDNLVISDAKFRHEFVEQLTRLIPFITDLTVETFSYASFQQLPLLLESYQATLTSLTLTGHYYGDENGPRLFGAATRRLIFTLNTLSHLTNLKFSGHCLSSSLLYILAPTLTRLERFELEHPPHYDSLNGPIFAGLSTRCTHLQLPSTLIYWSKTKIVDSLTDLVVNVDNYNLNDYPNGLPDSSVNCISQLAALRHLCVSFKYQSPLNTARLRQLIRLQQPDLELELLGLSFNPADLGLPFDTERPLANVKQLKLEIGQGQIDETAVGHLVTNVSAWFPRLKRLSVPFRHADYSTFKDVVGGLSIDGCVINVEPLGGQ